MPLPCSTGHDDVLLGEVAKQLGIARSTAWARVLRGLIPAEYRGGRYLVSRRTLARLVRQQSKSASRIKPKQTAGRNRGNP